MDNLYSDFLNESKSMDVSNIIEIEKFLFYCRYQYREHPAFNKYLKFAISIVLESEDESLIETLIIVLEKRVLEYNNFFLLARSKISSSEKIYKALYNTIREEVPEVRQYVGEG